MRVRPEFFLVSLLVCGLLLFSYVSILSGNTLNFRSAMLPEMNEKSINTLYEMNITLVGRFEEGENIISDVVTYNQYAIVADIYDSLKVLDTTKINTPEKVFHDWPGGRWNGLDIVGNRLYVAHHGDGLQIFDITNPENPLKYGILWLNEDPPYTNPQDVVVEGDYAYLADDFRGLQVIDVGDISWPIGVGRWNDGGNAKGIAVEGSYAYVIERSGELEVINISDPLNPFEVGNFTDGGLGNNIVVKDEIAYVADLSHGLEIFNVSNPYAPTLITKYNVGSGEASGLFLENTTVFIADGLDGLEVVNVSNLHEPVRLAQYPTEKYSTNVYVNGSLIYLCQQEGRLDILDLSGSLPAYEEPVEIIEIISDRVLMDPIKIESDSDFLEYNFFGSGTVEDPFMLENIHILNNRTSSIMITNTNAHFIIRNCFIDGISLNFGGMGIYLQNVVNGIIVNNTITRASQGVVLINCENIVVAGNQIVNNSGQAMMIVDTTHSIISDNIFVAQSYEYSSSSNDYGIEMHTSNWNVFLYNKFYYYRLQAIYVGTLEQNNTFLYNAFIGNNRGMIQQIKDSGSDNQYRYNYFDVWQSPDSDSNAIVDIPFPIFNNSLFDPCPMVDIPIHTLTTLSIHIDPAREFYIGEMNISWNPVIDSYNTSLRYSLQISEDGIHWIPIITNSQNTHLIWNSRLVSNGSYTLRVIAQCETGLLTYGFKSIDIGEPIEGNSTTTSPEGTTDTVVEVTTTPPTLTLVTPGYTFFTLFTIILVTMLVRKRD